MDHAAKIMDRLDALGRISEEPDRLTRRFATPAMRKASDLVGGWMQESGMSVRQDPIGNLFGRFPGAAEDAKVLLLGSHLDTVPDAGKFDGALGVVMAVSCVEKLARARLPFAIEVAAFADEEGSRFHTSYLGSSAVVGDTAQAHRPDIRAAIREFGGDPNHLEQCRISGETLLAYAEVHIEQGPQLERENLPVGVVRAIAGQTRANVRFAGKAGHAGTTPMDARQDALCAAARFVLDVESHARRTNGLVATVGKLTVEPGASNVIPGCVDLTVDVRHESDAERLAAVDLFKRIAPSWTTVGDTPAVRCSDEHVKRMAAACLRHQPRALDMLSGAGHDAAILARIAPVAMLFVRCKEGLSHHPAESVEPGDVAVAFDVFFDYIHALV